MDRRDFAARLDRLTTRLPAPRTDDEQTTVGDLLDRIRDPEHRELIEGWLWTVLVDATADEAARADAAGRIYRSGLFDG